MAVTHFKELGQGHQKAVQVSDTKVTPRGAFGKKQLAKKWI